MYTKKPPSTQQDPSPALGKRLHGGGMSLRADEYVANDTEELAEKGADFAVLHSVDMRGVVD